MLDATSAIRIKKRCVVFVKHVHVQAECEQMPILCVYVCESVAWMSVCSCICMYMCASVEKQGTIDDNT